jgi:hypothetical protein
MSKFYYHQGIDCVPKLDDPNWVIVEAANFKEALSMLLPSQRLQVNNGNAMLLDDQDWKYLEDITNDGECPMIRDLIWIMANKE